MKPHTHDPTTKITLKIHTKKKKKKKPKKNKKNKLKKNQEKLQTHTFKHHIPNLPNHLFHHFSFK